MLSVIQSAAEFGLIPKHEPPSAHPQSTGITTDEQSPNLCTITKTCQKLAIATSVYHLLKALKNALDKGIEPQFKAFLRISKSITKLCHSKRKTSTSHLFWSETILKGTFAKTILFYSIVLIEEGQNSEYDQSSEFKMLKQGSSRTVTVLCP